MKMPSRLAAASVLALALLAAACASAPEDRDKGPAPPPISTASPVPEPPAEPAPEPSTAAPKPAAAAPADATAPEAPPPSPVAAAPAPPDPLQEIRNQAVQEENRRLALERAKNRMDAAQAEVETLEKRLLAVRNPFLPRPQLPPDEAKAWEGLDGAARAQRVEDQLAAARVELDAARRAYTDLGGRLD